jgi:zinc transport system substrate-binding protein
MSLKKTYLWSLVAVVLVIALGYAFKASLFGNKPGMNHLSPAAPAKLQVVGTFYPLAHFAQRVGGDYVTVANITPAGAEPHDYEPTPQDIVKAYDTKVFVMNGGGVDTWAERIEPDLQAHGVLVVDMHQSIKLMTAPAGAETTMDPHIWLDPVLAEQEVQLICAALVQADPAHADVYNRNADAYVAQLQILDDEFKAGLSDCQLHDIVTSHAAFGYLARQYNLNQIAIAGLSPDAEPSIQQLAEIAQLTKQKNIKYIFFETLVSPKLSQTIATEVGAQTIAFNPLEGLTDVEISSGQTYLTEMRGNLASLRVALQCQ